MYTSWRLAWLSLVTEHVEWSRANDSNLAASWTFFGLTKSARLQLPSESFHASSFTLDVHHVMRVGHLESMVWCSLLYFSPARLPLAWDVTRPLIPRGLPSAMMASAKWLVRALEKLLSSSLIGLLSIPSARAENSTS